MSAAPAARGMAGHIAAFSGALRSAGVPSHARAVVDACRSAGLVDLADREQFYWALRTNFVTDPAHFSAFDRAFHAFWREGPPGDEEPLPPDRMSEVPSAVASEGAAAGEARLPHPPASGGASPDEVLVRKDLRTLAPGDEPRLLEILRELLAKLSTRPSRRERPSFHGHRLEFRRIFRENLRYGGEILRLVHREKKLGRRRLAFLGDVSGSMDVYNRFFFRLAYGLARLEPGSEVYAFSTRLFRLTGFVRGHHGFGRLEKALEDTRGWSGGTRIGECLKEFSEVLHRGAHLRQTVVVILSDGWDRGEPDLLRRQMIRLKGAVERVYWLNPLKGDPEYKPLCRGMAAALPYLDGFHAAHNLESLGAFARRLQRLR